MVKDNARVKVAQLDSLDQEDSLISLFINSTRKNRGGRRARPRVLQNPKLQSIKGRCAESAWVFRMNSYDFSQRWPETVREEMSCILVR